MSNWCFNHIKGIKKEVAMQKLLRPSNDDPNKLVVDLAMTKPIPEEFTDKEDEATLNKLYDWCLDNWGVRWIFSSRVIDNADGTLDIYFDTKWNPPMPVLDIVAEDSDFELFCAIEGCNSHRIIYANGKMIQHQSYNPYSDFMPFIESSEGNKLQLDYDLKDVIISAFMNDRLQFECRPGEVTYALPTIVSDWEGFEMVDYLISQDILNKYAGGSEFDTAEELLEAIKETALKKNPTLDFSDRETLALIIGEMITEDYAHCRDLGDVRLGFDVEAIRMELAQEDSITNVTSDPAFPETKTFEFEFRGQQYKTKIYFPSPYRNGENPENPEKWTHDDELCAIASRIRADWIDPIEKELDREQ